MKILVIVLNKFKNDTRVLKELKSLESLGFIEEIHLYAIWDQGLKEEEFLGTKTKIHRLKSNIKCKPIVCKVMKYFDIFRQIIKINKNRDFQVIHAHDFTALPIAVTLKYFTKVNIIYDSHEIQSEVCNKNKWLTKIIYFMENVFIKKADQVIVVSDSINKWYKDKFNLNEVFTLKNIPERISKEKTVNLREKLSLIDNDILFIYLGNLVPHKRGIEELLEIFSKNIKNKHILFMGSGNLKNTIEKYSNKSTKIHYLEPVPPNEVIYYAKEADVGINFGKKGCLNSYYGIANKLYEYVISGLSVIVSDFPERAKIIDRYDCGWKIDTDDEYDVQEIENLILSITQESVIIKKNNALNNSKNVSWENESKTLITIYESINTKISNTK